MKDVYLRAAKILDRDVEMFFASSAIGRVSGGKFWIKYLNPFEKMFKPENELDIFWELYWNQYEHKNCAILSLL